MRKIFLALAASLLMTVGEAAVLKQATANNLETKSNVYTIIAPGSVTVIPPATVYIIGPDGSETKLKVPAPTSKAPTSAQMSKEGQVHLAEEIHFLDKLITQTEERKIK